MLTSLSKYVILKFLTNLNSPQYTIGLFSGAGFIQKVPPEVNQNHSLRAPQFSSPSLHHCSSYKKDKTLVASTKFLIQGLLTMKPLNNWEEIFNWEINGANSYKCPKELAGMWKSHFCLCACSAETI